MMAPTPESYTTPAPLLKKTLDPIITKPADLPEIIPENPIPEIRHIADLGNFLKNMDYRHSRHNALKKGMALWKPESEIKPYFDDLDDDFAFFRLAAKKNGLSIHRIEGNLMMIKNLNLPAIMAFYPPDGVFPIYLTLAQIEDHQLTLSSGDSSITVDPDAITDCWPGQAYIVWHNFFSYTGIIPLNSKGESIITLKMHLRDIGFEHIDISPFYDTDSRNAVITIQKKHGIVNDGMVGPLTKIALYNEMTALEIPHIVGTSPDPVIATSEQEFER
jgi:general secretion pathway protein A